MDTQLLIPVIGVYFTAAFLKGLTGLGFSTICLGILVTFIDIRLAIPLVFIPSLSSNLMVMAQAGRFFESLKRFWFLFLTAIPGLLMGVWFLDNRQDDLPKVILGCVMLLYGLWGLKTGIVHMPDHREKQLKGIVGLISGLVNGATGSQIMPIMPYLLSLKMDRNLFVQTINTAFTVNTLIMMICLGKLGIMTWKTTGVSALGVIPVAMGIAIGGHIRKRVSDQVFRKMVLVFLILLGINLVLKPFV